MNYLAFITYLLGFLVAAGYDDLSYNKVATQAPIYPSTNAFYIAQNALDRNTSTCMRTNQMGRHSPYKSMWWKVDLGGLYNIYSIHILFKNYDGWGNRQQGRFAGFSLYVSNTGDIEGSTRCYKDGQQLPPLNFTTVCTEYGRYVIFYNERLDTVNYPDGYEVLNVYIELCEVQIQGCKRSGVYGRKCDMPCPTNCRNNVCHIQNGTCFSCKAGWTGMTCNMKCEPYWYGERCSKRCSGHCRDNVTCNHVTGQCHGGCDAGWTGALCEQVVTVWITLRVTNRLVTVTVDANLDTQTFIAAKNVHLDIMEKIAKNIVTDIVLTKNHVTMSEECVLRAVKTVTLEFIATNLVVKGTMVQTVRRNAFLTVKNVETRMAIVPFAGKDIMAEIALWFVFLTVNLRRVTEQTACAHALQVGWVTTALKNVFSPMEKIAKTSVATNVSIRHVIE